jgi:hypothetical protein
VVRGGRKRRGSAAAGDEEVKENYDSLLDSRCSGVEEKQRDEEKPVASFVCRAAIGGDGAMVACDEVFGTSRCCYKKGTEVEKMAAAGVRGRGLVASRVWGGLKGRGGAGEEGAVVVVVEDHATLSA